MKNSAALLARIALAVTSFAVVVLALMPDDVDTPTLVPSHVINHFAAFGFIALLLRLGWKEAGWVVALFIAMAFGVLLELLQWTVTRDRTPSLTDVGLNLLGCGAGIILAPFAFRILSALSFEKAP